MIEGEHRWRPRLGACVGVFLIGLVVAVLASVVSSMLYRAGLTDYDMTPLGGGVMGCGIGAAVFSLVLAVRQLLLGPRASLVDHSVRAKDRPEAAGHPGIHPGNFSKRADIGPHGPEMMRNETQVNGTFRHRTDSLGSTSNP